MTKLSLREAKKILNTQRPEDDDDFMALLRAKSGLIQTVFTAQLRADEGRFRKKQLDTLSALLDRMKIEERKIAKEP